ncbi:hypothetical protein HED60_15285 [Planctomycetales bacterium ZRK34]|nr:hypothetical protein HED60_15285 [Planctomycetales bacterium ZRK34]
MYQRLILLTLLTTLTLLAACEQENVSQYKVAKVNDSPASSSNTQPADNTAQPAAPFAGGGAMQNPTAGLGDAQPQMLGAIIPHPQRAWFFKTVGAAEEVSKVVDQFDALIKSVKITPDGANATWTLPEGWHQHGAQGMRYATILVGEHGNEKLEITVIPLGGGGAASDVLANVNRWRGQLSLPPVDEAGLAETTKQVDVSGVESVIVNIVGPKPSGQSPMAANGSGDGTLPAGHPPVGAGATAATPAAPSPNAGPIRYDTPEGWTPAADAGGMRLVSLKAGAADISVVALPPIAGDVTANVNRWRGQVGLTEVSAEDIQKQTEVVKIDGADAAYVDLSGPESAGADRPRIVAAMLPHGGQIWFFKMIGPSNAVGPQVEAFKQWLGSIHFNEGA